MMLIVPAAALPARGDEGTRCTAEFDDTLSPGLSIRPSSGTFTTGGETGTVVCDGKVDGKQPTGAGTWGAHGRYGTADPDSCTSGGEAESNHSLTVPTADGSVHSAHTAQLTYGALKGDGIIGGRFDSPEASGTFEVTPKEGDCVTAPITRIHVRLTVTLKK
ncbi:MAG: hypothetical protein ACRD0C_00300 [Acidimicrobiia bacterium]